MKQWMKHFIKNYTKKTEKPFSFYLTGTGYFLFYCYLFYTIIQSIRSLYRLDYSIHTISIPWFFISLILFPLLWIYSTKFDFYNYHNRKLFTLSSIVVLEGLLLLTLLYKLLSWMFIPLILKIPIHEPYTKSMALTLCRVMTQLPLLLLSVVLYHHLFLFYRLKGGKEKILEFKLSHYVKAKDFIRYDMKIVKDMKSGKPITVPMNDRYLHTLVDGTSGTAKTSSTILPSIRDDLNMRCKAEDLVQEQLREMYHSNFITPLTEKEPLSLSNLKIVGEQPDEIQDMLDTLRQTFPICGITVLAPEDSLTDAVCDLCDARGIPYNRIDPVPTETGSKKNHWIGMNPFFIPTDYTKYRDALVVKKAIIFADVMQAITELKGSADSYFAGINRQMLTNLSILAILTIPVLHHRQATPEDVQIFINNFDTMGKYNETLKELDQTKHTYHVITEYVGNELLGKGRVKLEDQCRGTRNIINEFLLLPANKEIFCSQHSIDFDSALAQSQITVFNYNLAAGETDATALGLLFLLSFNNAVLSRPGTEKTRSPHFFYIDELPVLLHPSIEKNFSLFRKFRVGMFVAIQTLDQFEKNALTKYLKGVILGCANIIVFGRSSLTDMVQFSKFAGMQDVLDSQKTVSQTSLSHTDTRLSYSSRDSITSKNIVEETAIRMKDFQEVTFFYTQNSRTLPPVHGKVEFLKKADWQPMKRKEDFIVKKDAVSAPIKTILKASYQDNAAEPPILSHLEEEITCSLQANDGNKQQELQRCEEKENQSEELQPKETTIHSDTALKEETIEDLFL